MKGGLNDTPGIHGIFYVQNESFIPLISLKVMFEAAGQDDLLHLA